MINNDEMHDLSQAARLDVGRAHNAWVRLKRAEYDMVRCRRDYVNALLKLRVGHKLGMRRLAKILGTTKDHISRYTASYRDPNYGVSATDSRRRVLDTPRAKQAKRGKWAREDRHLAGGKVGPESDVALLRSERTLRAAIERGPGARTSSTSRDQA